MAAKETLSPAKFQNPDGLGKPLLEKLRAHLGRLKEADPEVAARALRYVVDGEDDEVLLTLGGLKDAGNVLILGALSGNINWEKSQAIMKERGSLLRAGSGAPAAFWSRLGEVLGAVVQASGHAVQTPPSWPLWLVVLVSEVHTAWHGQDSGDRAKPLWPVSLLEAVLERAGLAADQIARVFLDEEAVKSFRVGHVWHQLQLTGPFSDWDQYFPRHLDTVREVLGRADANGRLFALTALGQAGFDFALLVDVLVELGAGPAKGVREAVLPLLQPIRDQARPHVEKLLAEGDSGQRHEAALLLWRLDGADAAERLRQHAAQESSERVKQTIDKLLAAPTEQAADAGRVVEYQLPPVQVEVGEVELGPAARAGLRAYFDQSHEKAQREYERQLEVWNGPDRPQGMYKPQKPKEVPDEYVKDLIAYLEGKKDKFEDVQHYYGYVWNTSLGDWLAPPDVKLIHVVRLASAYGFLQLDRGADSLYWSNSRDLDAYRARCPQSFSLRELDAIVATLPGGKPGDVARAYLLYNSGYASFADWGPEAVWPVFAEYPDVLRGMFQAAPNRRGDYNSRDWSLPIKRSNAFRVLAMMPQLPPGFIPILWDVALGDSKAERPLAQAALATVPGKTAKIVVALEDGQQVIRASAAEWLGKAGDPAAIEPLKQAFRKEKQELVKGVLMSALDALGADVNEFLDRAALRQEAAAGLAKKRPKGMGWVPLDRLPPLHWDDTGEPVAPEIVQWWVVQGIQQKSPVPGPLLRRYLALCRKHEAAALAKFLLTSWIAHDTRTASQEEAAAKAKKDTDQMWQVYSHHQYWVDQYDGKKENLYRVYYQKYANECIGSAVGEKGMLALVAAAGDGDCVKACEQYLRKWFGNRLAQCKCLVEVLSWIKHPLAIQVLLGVANRFRTKAIRKMAEEYVQALAEREGWTIDELADRTVPDAGFERAADESGKPGGDAAALVLDYGPRRFTVKLDDDLQPVIHTEEGKTVKNPPAPGKNDDADAAKAAKKTFSDAKKIVKDVVKRQAERLYEALCTQRTWRFDDWQRFLAQHPIVGKLCIRLAWAAFAPGEEGPFLGCFRPLEDGSLTNEKDEEARFEPDTRVRLAHACNTPAEVGAAWARHFEDYDVTPLFPQFGRATYVLPEEKGKETDIKDFEGHVLTTFKLRGKATKLGYVRGDAEDGGCFFLYRKPFSSLGLQAVVSFTGNCLPEQDVAAALTELYFTRLKGDREESSYWNPSKLELRKVPPVLLSECYNDVKQIAAEGGGFDPEWRTKSAF